MLNKLLDFLKGLPAHENGTEGGSPDDTRVAAAALMFHVIDADGVREDAERARLRSSLSQAFHLEGRELEQVLAAAEEADREAVDLYAFTSVIKRELDEEARIRFVGLLWEMVYADGERHELEDNVVWRVAELIGVSSRDRVTMRQEVGGRLADEGQQGSE